MPETASKSPETLRAVFDDLQPGSTNIEVADRATVEREAKKQPGAVEWKAASSVIPEIAKLLDIPLPELLVGFWQKADEVAAKREESKASPEKEFQVSFRDSKTEATFDPSIEVRLNGMPSKPIPFKIVLPLTFKGVVLTIKNGEIIDTAAGQCLIEGSIKLGAVTVAKLRKPVTITIASGLLGSHKQPAG